MTYAEIGALQDAMGYVSRGATEACVAALPSHTFAAPAAGNEEESCVVCQFAFVVGEVLSTLPCMHIFHQNCAGESLRHNKACPLCKADVTEK